MKHVSSDILLSCNFYRWFSLEPTVSGVPISVCCREFLFWEHCLGNTVVQTDTFPLQAFWYWAWGCEYLFEVQSQLSTFIWWRLKAVTFFFILVNVNSAMFFVSLNPLGHRRFKLWNRYVAKSWNRSLSAGDGYVSPNMRFSTGF